MKNFVQALVVAGIVSSAASVLAAEDAPKVSASKKPPAPHPYLGVSVSPAHPALANNLRDLLSPGQGLVVEDIDDEAPAAKAGIKLHDVLTSYDDQKLFASEQFAKLVHSGKPGQEVTLGYLRDGKLEKVQVKLGEAPAIHLAEPGAAAPFGGPMHHFFHWPHMMGHLGRMGPRHGMAAPTAPGDSFDSLTLKKLGDNKFRAEVQYTDKAGKTRKHSFEGTREELGDAIEAEQDMQPIEKMHLLYSLGLLIGADPAAGPWFGPGPMMLFDLPEPPL